jgi:hypothetical protein
LLEIEIKFKYDKKEKQEEQELGSSGGSYLTCLCHGVLGEGS